jgi:pentapeptide repeat protein
MRNPGMIRRLAAAAAVVGLLAFRPLITRSWTHWRVTHCGEGANLAGMDLTEADLSRANLKRANLRGANLTKARCFDSNLRGADLRDADLQLALLAGADLRFTQLGGARLNGAVYDRLTRWPKGFDARRNGAMRADWNANVWHAFGRPLR